MQYRRAKTPSGTYFFTVVTFRRRKFLCEPDNVELLRTAFRTVQSAHPFTIDAFVLLPEHLHCIWTLPQGDHDYSMCWNGIKNHFTVIVRMSSNYRHHRLNDVNGRKPSGNRATGNTKSGMTVISRNIATTYIGIQ
jgi:REP element-mobilizing transposase RayT